MAQIEHHPQHHHHDLEATTSAWTITPTAPFSRRHVHTHHHSLPHYPLDTTISRHEISERVTGPLPQQSLLPSLYSAPSADANDDLTFRHPLRKKPKLTSHATEPHSLPLPHPSPGMRRLVGISKTTSVPSFNSLPLNLESDNDERRPSSSSGISTTSSHPLHRTSSKTLQRSPSQKKPPASHSSYGVETTLGPPASYSTRRTLSQDRVRLDRSTGARNTNSPSREGSPTKARPESSHSSSRRDRSPSKPNDRTSDSEGYPTRLSPVKFDASPSFTESSDEATTQEGSSLVTADTQSVVTPMSSLSKANTMPSQEPTSLQGREGSETQSRRPARSEEDGKGSSSDEKKSEDLFLNIARTDASRSAGPAQVGLEKRRSRVSLPFFNSQRPSTGYKSSPIREQFDTASASGRSEALNYYSKRSSVGPHVPGAVARNYTQDAATRESGLDTQSSHPADPPWRARSRRYSAAISTTNTNVEPRTFSRPSTARNTRLVSDGNAFLDRPRMSEHNATESTISTTAPSTVWDELDDLKSRIKKLELTGKLPPSSAAAMTASERPKTATTAATTMSSSPKHKATAVAPLQSAIEGIPSNIHPNLHEALGNAKAVLSNEVYQKLQATAQDALQLSIMMNPETHNAAGSTIGLTSMSERQIRRRTESMCRSLTELAITILADQKQTPQPATRPASRDAYQSMSGLRSRRYSNETNDRPPVTSRVQSRLEIRRTSTGLGTAANPSTSTPEPTHQTPPTALPPMSTSSSSHVGRTASLVRSRRTLGQNVDGATDDEEGSPSIRPVSRAMTEVGAYRQMARDRTAYSREYTAQHPMPQYPKPSTADAMPTTRSQLPSHISAHLVPRRKYGNLSSNASNKGSPQDHTPVTPKEPWGRISIVQAASSPLEATPESQLVLKPASSRRSLGFTSRISSVSSRLRAAKGERNVSMRDHSEPRSARDIAPSGQILDNVSPLERHGSGQSIES